MIDRRKFLAGLVVVGAAAALPSPDVEAEFLELPEVARRGTVPIEELRCQLGDQVPVLGVAGFPLIRCGAQESGQKALAAVARRVLLEGLA